MPLLCSRRIAMSPQKRLASDAGHRTDVQRSLNLRSILSSFDANVLWFSYSPPKGVVVTQGTLLTNEVMLREDFGHDSSSTFVSWLPHCHDMGLIGGILQPLFVGAECVLMSPETFLRHPIRWLEAISKYGAKTSGAPNFAYELCVARRPNPEKLKTLDLSSWTVAFCGAEPVRPRTLEEFASAYSDAGFDAGALMPCYWMAETTLLAANRRLSKRLRFDVQSTRDTGKAHRVTSCGHIASGSELVIAEPQTHEEVEPGLEGEIWVKGDHVAAGYWNTEPSRCRFGRGGGASPPQAGASWNCGVWSG